MLKKKMVKGKGYCMDSQWYNFNDCFENSSSFFPPMKGQDKQTPTDQNITHTPRKNNTESRLLHSWKKKPKRLIPFLCSKVYILHLKTSLLKVTKQYQSLPAYVLTAPKEFVGFFSFYICKSKCKNRTSKVLLQAITCLKLFFVPIAHRDQSLNRTVRV